MKIFCCNKQMLLEALFVATPVVIIAGSLYMKDRPFISVTKSGEVIFFQKANTVETPYEYNPIRPESCTSNYQRAT